MAVAYRILGQSAPGTTTTTICGNGSPTSGAIVVSTLIICNRAATNKTFRVSARPNGTALANQHYLAYDTVVPANDTIIMTLGITLASTEVLEVYGSDTNVSFSAFGSIIT
jgi:hypothetical protein